MRLTSGGSHFSTLSGCEAADGWNNWENFKQLVADEETQCDSSKKLIVNGGTSDNVTLIVCVEDTGIGIPLNAQERVFMPFMQADSSTSRNYGGTGIGLSISKCLVELMGGQISFISRPQIGSTFSFTAVFRSFRKIPFNDMMKPNSEDMPSSFRGLKAVVVDGKPVRAAVTRYHLKRLGILVEPVNDIKKAVPMSAKICPMTNG